MFVGGYQSLSLNLFVGDISDGAIMEGQSADDFVFTFGYNFVSFVILSLGHCSLFDCG